MLDIRDIYIYIYIYIFLGGGGDVDGRSKPMYEENMRVSPPHLGSHWLINIFSVYTFEVNIVLEY